MPLSGRFGLLAGACPPACWMDGSSARPGDRVEHRWRLPTSVRWTPRSAGVDAHAGARSGHTLVHLLGFTVKRCTPQLGGTPPRSAAGCQASIRRAVGAERCKRAKRLLDPAMQVLEDHVNRRQDHYELTRTCKGPNRPRNSRQIRASSGGLHRTCRGRWWNALAGSGWQGTVTGTIYRADDGVPVHGRVILGRGVGLEGCGCGAVCLGLSRASRGDWWQRPHRDLPCSPAGTCWT